MGYVPVSVSIVRKLAWAFTLGVALVAAGCADSTGGGTVASGRMEAALPGALQKLGYTDGNLRIAVTTTRKTDGKVKGPRDLKNLVVDPDTGVFSGTLPFSLPADAYLFTFEFFYDDPTFGEVKVASIDDKDVEIFEDVENEVDISSDAMNFPNDDGDVFTNLEEAESGSDPDTVGPMVALLANLSYVDYNPGNDGSEASNTEATINDLGGSVTTFTDISAAGFAAALAGQDAVVLPEVQGGILLTDMDAAAEATLASYVQLGGTLIATQPSAVVSFLNSVFGLSLVSAFPSTTTLDTAMAADTPFADGPTDLPPNNGTSGVTQGSLPTSSRAIYHDASGNTAVAVIPFGTGRIVLLGWDWFFDPSDSQTEWFAVLKSALRTTAPTKVALLADTAYVDYIPGNSNSEASNLHASINRSVGTGVTPFKGLSPETIGAAVLNRKVLVIPEQFGNIAADLTTPAMDAIVAFVKAGGTVLFAAPNTNVALANTLFGLSLVSGFPADDPVRDDVEALGTHFASGPDTLTIPSATAGITLASLPAGSKAIYKDTTDLAVVAVVPIESGRLIFLGWDWFNAQPVGAVDDGWLDVLGRSIRTGLD